MASVEVNLRHRGQSFDVLIELNETSKEVMYLGQVNEDMFSINGLLNEADQTLTITDTSGDSDFLEELIEVVSETINVINL